MYYQIDTFTVIGFGIVSLLGIVAIGVAIQDSE
jgi:hypothetical protein